MRQNFIELSLFSSYLIPDEEIKALEFEEGLNLNIYDKVVSFQIPIL